jgi:hypothetical protein
MGVSCPLVHTCAIEQELFQMECVTALETIMQHFELRIMTPGYAPGFLNSTVNETVGEWVRKRHAIGLPALDGYRGHVYTKTFDQPGPIRTAIIFSGWAEGLDPKEVGKALTGLASEIGEKVSTLQDLEYWAYCGNETSIVARGTLPAHRSSP